MTAGGSDPALRRFELDAVTACLVMMVTAFALVAPWRGTGTALRVVLGVLGGGLLTAISYRAIKGAADLLSAVAAGQRAAEAPPPVLTAGRRAFLTVKFFTRYALLAVAAYVMLTCFRLHPVGVLAGATSPFLAALLQVVRMSRARSPHP